MFTKVVAKLTSEPVIKGVDDAKDGAIAAIVVGLLTSVAAYTAGMGLGLLAEKVNQSSEEDNE